MSCDSCYNGCTQIVQDECVRYTGNDVSTLSIHYGDSLNYVEQQIITNLVPLLTGSGDVITVNPSHSCSLVNSYLVSNPNTSQVVDALVRSICNLQGQVTTNASNISTIEASYTVGCLTGITGTSGTHAILQQLITQYCTTASSLTSLSASLPGTYVALADLNTLIAAYLAANPPVTSQQYTKMVPYTVLEYYGPLSNFDGTGKGIAALGWDKVYLCNGLNGTPDKRGRTTVGAIQGVPGGTLNPAVDPSVSSNNPNYSLYTTTGANTVTLDVTMIPSHSHTTTVTIPDHYHGITPMEATFQLGSQGTSGIYAYISDGGTKNTTSPNVPLNTTVTVGNTGGGLPHNNIQPVIAAYYIIYLP